MTYRSVNPFDGSVLETFQEIDDDQLEGRCRPRTGASGTGGAGHFPNAAPVLTVLRLRCRHLIGTNPADNMAAPPDAAAARMNSRRELRGAGTPVLSSK